MQIISRSRAMAIALALAFLCFACPALAVKFDAKNAKPRLSQASGIPDFGG